MGIVYGYLNKLTFYQATSLLGDLPTTRVRGHEDLLV